MNRTFRVVIFVVFAVILVGPLAAQQGEVVAREGKGWLERRDGRLVLHVKGTPYEMGFQHGVLVRDMVRKNVQSILDNQGPIGRTDGYRAYKSLRGLLHAVLRRYVPARIKEEMRGLADGSGVSFDDVEASHYFPEAFHCSGMSLQGDATRDGSLYHVRILDYLTEAGLQETAMVIDHEPEGFHRWLNVGFAGFVGSVTGMNEARITIGEMGGGGRGYYSGIPMAFLLRDALERASTLDEALEIFRTAPRTCEYYYVISDAKIPDARGVYATPEVFETAAPGTRYGFVRVGKPPAGAVDGKVFLDPDQVEIGEHHILFKNKAHQVEAFVALQPKDCVVISGYDRYQHFVDRLMPRYGQVDERALMEMVKRPVSMKHNLHVAIFHPGTLEAWIAVAAPDGSPACDQPYFHYSMQEEGPGE